MPPSVTVISDGVRAELAPGEAEPLLISAGPMAIEVSGVRSVDLVQIDGRPAKATFAAGAATILIDLARETGFHELRVGRDSFLFGTEDAKLRIDGILDLLDYLAENGIAWSGAMYFSGTRAVLRDLRLDRAWLDHRVPEILALADDIARAPATIRGTRRRRATHGVPDVAATLRLLRRQSELLEELEGGPVTYVMPNGTTRAYAPREVVIRERVHVLDTPGNRRATALISGAVELARRVLDIVPTSSRGALSEMTDALERRLLVEPFRSLYRRRSHLRLPAALGTEESLDDRYVRVHQLVNELFGERHWDPERDVLPERAYAGLAHQIYQRFCGHLLADQLGLSALDPGDGLGPHFGNEEWELYVDVTPPHAVLADWRDESERPANLRPDLVLRHLSTQRVAVFDAKYRAQGQRASSSSLSDVQLYLQAYQRKAVAVLYPPVVPSVALAAHEVTDGDYSIFEIPFLPKPEMADFLEREVEPLIGRLLE